MATTLLEDRRCPTCAGPIVENRHARADNECLRCGATNIPAEEGRTDV